MVCESIRQSPLGPHSAGLNPCFNGIWSARENQEFITEQILVVLILVLMEYGLRDDNVRSKRVRRPVLILVLMEYGLRGSNL